MQKKQQRVLVNFRLTPAIVTLHLGVSQDSRENNQEVSKFRTSQRNRNQFYHGYPQYHSLAGV